MHSIKSRLLIAFLTAACFSFAVAKTSEGKVKFPADEPTFTVEFPAGWTCKADKDGNLDCDPGDDSGYVLSILLLNEIGSTKELKAMLPKLATSMAEGAKIKNFQLGDVETSTNGNELPFTGVTGDGKVEGIDFVVMVHAFEPKKGKFYAFVTAASAEEDKKHEKQYDEITASIEAIED